MAMRVFVIGWDGATFRLAEPWLREGLLPNLQSAIERGTRAVLESTIPPVTFPAWSSMVTGYGPGRHGVFDFSRRERGTYRIRFINSRARKEPAFWNLAHDAGLRSCIVAVPTTYPPEPIQGCMISGFDSPVSTHLTAKCFHPHELYTEVHRMVGAFPVAGIQEVRIGRGWHESALAVLRETIRIKTHVLESLLQKEQFDLVMAVYGESDTVAHHFWPYADPQSSRRWFEDSPEHLRNAIRDIYMDLDTALGRLLRYTDSDTTVFIVSDHGFGGASDRIVHLARWLESEGYTALHPADAGWFDSLKAAGLAYTPAWLQTQFFRWAAGRAAGRIESRSRLGKYRWSKTRVFSEELSYAPSLWINLRGREPEGIVEPGPEYEELLTELSERLLAWNDPIDGHPVVRHVHRRLDLYSGPHTEFAPDLILELEEPQGYQYTALPSGRSKDESPVERLSQKRLIGGKGAGMAGTHRREGIFVAAGPKIVSTTVPATSDISVLPITSVAPSVLTALGLPVPVDMEAKPI